MRTVLHLLICVMLNGWLSTASAEDLFLGRVLSVDRDAGRLSVVLIDASDGLVGEENDGKHIEVTIPPDRLPKYLSPGSVIRIWADRPGEAAGLNATRVIALGHGARGNDPTGVRRRIGRSQGMYGGKGGGKGHGRH
jgi:hypothetical protein